MQLAEHKKFIHRTKDKHLKITTTGSCETEITNSKSSWCTSPCISVTTKKNISDCYFIYRSWLCAWYCMWAGDNYLYHQVGLWVAPLLLSASSVTVNTGKHNKKMACEDFTRPFFSQASFVPHSKDSAKEGLLIVYHQGHCLSEISLQVRTNHPHEGVYDMLSSHVWLPHNM